MWSLMSSKFDHTDNTALFTFVSVDKFVRDQPLQMHLNVQIWSIWEHFSFDSRGAIEQAPFPIGHTPEAFKEDRVQGVG